MFSLEKLKTVFFLYCCFLFGFTFKVLPQSEIWTTKAPMPTPRAGCSACEVDGIIYVIGGLSKDSWPVAVTTVEAYDPSTDTWETKANMPTKRHNLAACSLNGKIYAIGGSTNPVASGDAHNETEEYNPETDTWETKANMPTRRAYLAACSVDGKIYVFGGKDGGNHPRPELEVYDPGTDTWEEKVSMLTARNYIAACAANGLIYALGGAIGVSDAILSHNEVYDPVLDRWIRRKDMRTARMGLSASTISGKVYAIGGQRARWANGLKTFEEYNPERDSWRPMIDMPTARAHPASCTVNDKIYVIGGTTDGDLSGVVATVEVYDRSRDLNAYLDYTEVNKTYAVPGSDSICIAAKVNDPPGFTLVAAIEGPNQTPIASLQLYDDGLHNDGNAYDSLYANIWPIVSEEEKQYFVDLDLSRITDDTLAQHINNAVLFTTIGPVVFESFEFDSSDTSPNPDEQMKLKLTLLNNGSSTIAENVKAKIIPLDSAVTVLEDFLIFGDIEAGAQKTPNFFYTIDISNDCPGGKEVSFRIDISSNKTIFWSDTFSIKVESLPEMVKIDREIPQEFGLFQNYPNPFNAETTITLFLPMDEFVNLEVYNTLGQKVTTLESDLLAAGRYKYTWQAVNQPSGLYFYRLETADFSKTYKMLLVR